MPRSSSTAAAATSKAALIEAMIGKGREALEESYTDDIALPPPCDRPVVLEANKLSLARGLRDVSFKARSGEVLGIYGFMGCGQLELARILFGKLRPDQGNLVVAGDQKTFASIEAIPAIAFTAQPDGSSVWVNRHAGNKDEGQIGADTQRDVPNLILSSTQGLLGASTLGSIAYLLQRAPHGGHQPQQPGLQNIISGTNLERFDGRLLAKSAWDYRAGCGPAVSPNTSPMSFLMKTFRGPIAQREGLHGVFALPILLGGGKF
jgi:energy-coupling factor transporter ATP-binding protein EcfA2